MRPPTFLEPDSNGIWRDIKTDVLCFLGVLQVDRECGMDEGVESVEEDQSDGLSHE